MFINIIIVIDFCMMNVVFYYCNIHDLINYIRDKIDISFIISTIKIMIMIMIICLTYINIIIITNLNVTNRTMICKFNIMINYYHDLYVPSLD